jgi:hypothetical protein
VTEQTTERVLYRSDVDDARRYLYELDSNFFTAERMGLPVTKQEPDTDEEIVDLINEVFPGGWDAFTDNWT